MTPGGLLVHSCDEWPCAVCRPSQISESRAYCLCLNCAYAIVAAASAGEQGARALLDEISDALSLLEAQQPEPRLPANWSHLGFNLISFYSFRFTHWKTLPNQGNLDPFCSTRCVDVVGPRKIRACGTAAL
jgi:hypothetical protein